jgi:predicted transcriptional regulator
VNTMSEQRTTTDLAAVLREALDDAGLNPFQVSQRAGIPYAAIHGFVHNDRDMMLSTASKLCDLLGLELRPMQRSRKAQ